MFGYNRIITWFWSEQQNDLIHKEEKTIQSRDSFRSKKREIRKSRHSFWSKRIEILKLNRTQNL